MSKLIQALPAGPLDIVGDVHGEWSALEALLSHLGYAKNGSHPQGRHLVFVGDLCDRGPDSPKILTWLKQAMVSGNVFAILGNHEMNLLLNVPKDGSGWFFPCREPYDEKLYAPWEKSFAKEEQEAIREQLLAWPVILERDDIRIVHAAWTDEAVAELRKQPENSKLLDVFEQYQVVFKKAASLENWYADYLHEKEHYKECLLDCDSQMPLLTSIGLYESMHSRFNPITALTTGIEAPVGETFYSGGRWRFAARLPWWQEYQDDVPVVFGHYWRAWKTFNEGEKPMRRSLFSEAGNQWLGLQGNAFCIDFSVGARWRDRRNGISENESAYHLVALRWPEKTLMFDDGREEVTCGFGIKKTN